MKGFKLWLSSIRQAWRVFGEYMSAAQPCEPQASSPSESSSLRFVRHVVDLTTIFDPTVNVVTLQREPSKPLASEVLKAAGEVGFHRLFAVTPNAAAQTTSEELAGLGRLAKDVQFWIEVLTELTDCERVGVRLARVDAAMCPRFHVDHVTLRLVTTYVGPGTEFVANGHTDRRHLGHGAFGTSDEASGLLVGPRCIREADAFDVVLLKGEAWPGNAGRGAVHRSPAMRCAEPRLVMTLDPMGS